MEDKHQMHFIMIKTRVFYNKALMLRLSFGRSVSKHICNTLIHKGLRSHYVPITQKQSHSALFSWSYNCFSFLSSLKLQGWWSYPYITMGEEIMGPQMMGKELILWSSSYFLWTRSPKGNYLAISSKQTSSSPPHEASSRRSFFSI